MKACLIAALATLVCATAGSVTAQRGNTSGAALPIPGEIRIVLKGTWPDSGMLTNRRVQVEIETVEDFHPREACFDWDSLGTRPDTLVIRIRGRKQCQWAEPVLMDRGIAHIAMRFLAPRTLVVRLPADRAVLRIDDIIGPVAGFEIRSATMSPRFIVPTKAVGVHEWGMANILCNPRGTSEHLCLGFIEALPTLGPFESDAPLRYWQHGVFPPMQDPTRGVHAEYLRHNFIVTNGDSAAIARILKVSRDFTDLFRSVSVDVTTTRRTRYRCADGVCEPMGLEWSIP